MPYRNRSNKRPINSVKNIIDSQGGLVAGTAQLVSIANAKDNAALTDVDGVEIGATINSIFLNVQVSASGTAALANVYMIVFKNPGGNLVFPNGNVLGTNDNKKHVFHQEMLMTEKNTTAIPRTLFKGVLMLPKHMRRMGFNDDLQLQLFAPGVNFDFCVQCIYKWYR